MFTIVVNVLSQKDVLSSLSCHTKLLLLLVKCIWLLFLTINPILNVIILKWVTYGRVYLSTRKLVYTENRWTDYALHAAKSKPCSRWLLSKAWWPMGLLLQEPHVTHNGRHPHIYYSSQCVCSLFSLLDFARILVEPMLIRGQVAPLLAFCSKYLWVLVYLHRWLCFISLVSRIFV